MDTPWHTLSLSTGIGGTLTEEQTSLRKGVSLPSFASDTAVVRRAERAIHRQLTFPGTAALGA